LKSVADWLVYTWMPLYLFERFHMSLTAAGFAATMSVQAASVCGILLGGSLADRWALRSGAGRLLTQALGLAAAAPFLFLVGAANSPTVLLTALAVFGLGRGMNDANGMPVLCQFVSPQLRATGYGLLNCVGTLAGGFTAFAAGSLKATFGLGVMLEAAGLLLLIAAILLWRLATTSKAA
jgi:MFS transporter, Spinster family, sphingosine-1-phosphate transporter